VATPLYALIASYNKHLLLSLLEWLTLVAKGLKDENGFTVLKM
jgi:hypothetical protein